MDYEAIESSFAICVAKHTVNKTGCRVKIIIIFNKKLFLLDAVGLLQRRIYAN